MDFSYEESNEKFLLVYLQGVDYKLYNLEIATIKTLIETLLVEEFFCTGSLRETAINIFLQHANAIYFV